MQRATQGRQIHNRACARRYTLAALCVNGAEGEERSLGGTGRQGTDTIDDCGGITCGLSHVSSARRQKHEAIADGDSISPRSSAQCCLSETFVIQ
jgi:hypothetical protein